jgi:uncharacterized protein YbjT (DUF2867 family)
LKLKGEIENAIKATEIRSIHILQPSILLGERKEFRPGEKVGKFLMKPLSFVLPSKYKPIHAREVAKAMLVVVKSREAGTTVYQFTDIKSLAKSV